MTGLVVDLFAGGGGASTGIEAVLGRVDVAINHDPIALAVHRANHPQTLHLEASIWEVRPRDVTKGRPVHLLWASPDCTHFSVAKGDVPRSKGIRSLAWVVARWAKDVRPSIIMLENVQEFRTWGPLGKDKRPIKSRSGQTFRGFVRRLESLGYVVEYRVLDASLYGAPTRRRRLFLIARCDGASITWPEPTHGKGLLPLRTAAECIDWSLPCPSIFERKRPLANKTLWRIAQGIRRFVLEHPAPFIVRYNGGDFRGQGIKEPLTTLDCSNRFGVVDPFVVKVNHGKRQARTESASEPLSTVTAQRRGHALVVPHVSKFQENSIGQELVEPLHTVMAGAQRFGIVAPTLIQTGYGERPGQAARVPGLHKPIGTCVNGQKHALVSAFIARHFGGPRPPIGSKCVAPLPTVTAVDHHSLAAVALAKFRGTQPNQPGSGSVEEPLPTISAGGIHSAEVRAFLTAYYGNDATGGQQLTLPMRTQTTKARLGLVTIEGVDYQIVDIGMRMLEPHELLAAQFGRFATDYDLSAAKSKAAKVRLIGNSVCPEMAEALVRANVGAEARAVA